jgi:hypothetical protein
VPTRRAFLEQPVRAAYELSTYNMDVFELRRRLIDDYRAYVTSFISIRDERIRQKVDDELADGCCGRTPASG